MGKAKQRVVLGLAIALLSTVSISPTSASSSCVADSSVDTFDVVAKARRHVYRIGETALIDVWVTDRFTGEPQEDIDAGVMIYGKDDKALFDASKTDAKGHALMQLWLKRSHVKTGWAKAVAAAWDPIITPVYCTGRSGYQEYPKLFRIRD